MWWWRFLFLLALTLGVGGCSRPSVREYELRGQVVAINPARQEITIKHDDIPNFMPGMTMPFKVRDARLLDGRAPGDLVRAVLVLERSDAFLRTVERTGSAPLTEAPPPERGLLLEPGDPVPDARFIDETGADVRFSDLQGRVVAVTFVYTRCPLPNFCPLMDRHFRAIQDRITADAALKGQALLRSISFDPEFDRPPVLARHARASGADPSVWKFLTGTRADIEGFATPLGVSILRDNPKSVEIQHNLRTAVIGRDGRLVSMFGGNDWTPDDLLTALRGAVATR
jgi:protein SCO1/2